jgi:phosphoenolpyruvate---glycerone phosphotransferase subunit DhaK
VSPPRLPHHIPAPTHPPTGGAGVLHIVKNYTGDVLNFQMAAELADDDDIEVASVVVNDDVAVEDSTFTAGRRGVGGTVFVEKIAGAAAEAGQDLAAITSLAKDVNDRTRSFGVALTPCTVPAAGKPGFELGPDEIELGIGIHGEPGRTRAPIAPAAELVARALESIHADMPLSGSVVVMLNGMGATPLIELYIAYAAAAQWLEAHGVTVVRNLVGNYITSLDMAGFSVTVGMLTDDQLSLWDAPVQTPALRWGR